MKTLLITFAFIAATITTFAGQDPVDLTIGWTDPNPPGSTVGQVYTNALPNTNGTLCATVSGTNAATITFQRPSDQYLYVRLSDPASNPTNYIAPSLPSNIIRIRVRGNGTVSVMSP